MSLVTIWSPFFQSPVRMNGRSYQLAGRVKRVEPDNGELVRAEVRGREPYTVTITADGRHAVAECTCPRFAGGTFCKHVWATLLDLQQSDTDGPGASAQQVAKLRPRQPKARKRDATAAPARSSEPEWIGRLSLLRPPTYDKSNGTQQVFPAQRQICYVVLPRLCSRHGGLVVDLRQRTAIASGWSKSKALKISAETLESLADPIDRELCALILGGSMVTEYDDDRYSGERSHATYRIASGAQRSLLKRMIATERCFIDSGEDDQRVEMPLRWDGDQPWVLWMVGTEVEDQLAVKAQLRRGEKHRTIDGPQVILGGIDGLVIGDGKAAPFDDRDAYRWVTQFREDFRSDVDGAKPIRVPLADVKRFLDRLYMLPQLPEIDLPAGVGREELHVDPVPHLDLFSPTSPEGRGILSGNVKNQLAARVWFAYGEQRVNPSQPGRFVPVTPPPPEDPPEDTPEDTPDDASAEAASAAVPDTPAEPQEQIEDDDSPPPTGVLMRRQRRAERQAIAALASLGLRQVGSDTGDALSLPMRQMPLAVAELTARGWIVSADQQALRVAGPPSLTISSGIDWFELRGNLKYQADDGRELEVPLPEILAAARDGRNMITLDDGSTGLLPEQWLTEHGLLTALGQLEGDHLRFKASQAAILDALIDEKELTAVDDPFRRARERLRQFEGVKPLDASEVFKGSLREYQQQGLGWFAFLRWFGVGGILADDMGLGKTVQVLSMIQARRHGVAGHIDEAVEGGAENEAQDGSDALRSTVHAPRPSLIVVPRSVVFNWVDEAEKFTPDLRVVAYAGADRHDMRERFEDYDVIVTSYGLMRRDVEELRHFRFDYVVLDEAQAIKNPSSQSAKASRLIDANHRLALTGTPIENHLGDIWSIFEFLNPGMLGANARFNDLMRNPQGGARVPTNGAGAPDDDAADGDSATNGATGGRAETLRQVAASLRPFILRRTKQQVLRDLPPKTEQTLLCQMEPEQRQVYDDLRRYYHGALMKQLDESGAVTGDARAMAGGKGSGFMVLEALLRLRQAACHPALIDGKGDDLPSAKLDLLLDRLADIIEEGSKALVFSQFTSMLSLVKPRLEERGIKFCYLDGQTRDRKGVVEQFQTDESIPVFLISLKAGGTGLNLTAADYVYLLDPWWNPAVERQAIDRTYRIGQTKPVFAYRMICEDTVEQRIADLQHQKRQLAEAIVGGEENILRSLSREDLERLLS